MSKGIEKILSKIKSISKEEKIIEFLKEIIMDEIENPKAWFKNDYRKKIEKYSKD